MDNIIGDNRRIAMNNRIYREVILKSFFIVLIAALGAITAQLIYRNTDDIVWAVFIIGLALLAIILLLFLDHSTDGEL